MMADTFTKGPWHFINGNLRRVTAASHPAVMNSVSICGIHRIGRHVGKENDAEQVANGHLIAASPDLYEALILVTGTLIDRAADEQEVIQRAQLALAKAKGPALDTGAVDGDEDGRCR